MKSIESNIIDNQYYLILLFSLILPVYSRPGYTKIERKPSWSKDEEGFSFVRENRYLCNTKGSREKLGGSSSKVLSSRVY